MENLDPNTNRPRPSPDNNDSDFVANDKRFALRACDCQYLRLRLRYNSGRSGQANLSVARGVEVATVAMQNTHLQTISELVALSS